MPDPLWEALKRVPEFALGNVQHGGQVVREFLEGNPDSNVLGESIGNAGTVINPKTVGFLKSLIKDRLIYDLEKGRAPDMFSLAEHYFRSKYPKISDFARVKFMDSHDGSRAVADNARREILVSKPSFGEGTVHRAIESLGHEYTHMLRGVRNPDRFQNYIPASKDTNAYYNQLEEVLARQGGKTAKEGFKKFIELLEPPVPEGRVLYMRWPDRLKRVIEKIME